MNQFARTELLFGAEGMAKLAEARVAIFGVGGVGGYVAEALARTGIGSFDLIDNDEVSLTNINRQIIATHDTIGMPKVEVMRARMLSINPEAKITLHQCFFLPENQDQFDFAQYDYVVDAVDTVTAKIAIILKAKAAGVPVMSSMGAGNKVNPAMFEVADIYKTSVCPLARVMRQAMKKHGVKHLKVVYSKEVPIVPAASEESKGTAGHPVPGSTAFAPSVAGLIIASEVVKDIIGFEQRFG